jgi:hypothetical protein
VKTSSVAVVRDKYLAPVIQVLRRMVFTTEACQSAACFQTWLNHWQTVVGAAIALPLAFGAIVAPLFIEGQRYSRRLAAMRASMPLRLSQVVNYAKSAMKALAAVRGKDNADLPQGTVFKKPEVPPDLIDALERTIEAIGSRRVVKRLANMIGEMQVLDARMGGLESKPEMGANIDAYLIQAATVYAQAESLFDFARRRAPTTASRIDWGDVQRAFRMGQVYEGSHPDVHAFVARLRERGKNPEETDPRMSRWMRLRLWLRIKREKFEEWRNGRHPGKHDT